MSGLSSESIDQVLKIRMQTIVSTTLAFVSVSKSVGLNGANFYDVVSMPSRLWCYLSFCTYLQKLQSGYWPEYRLDTPSSLSSTSVIRLLVRTFLGFVTGASHILIVCRCLKHYFHHNSPWLPTCRNPIIRPHIHISWWVCRDDHSYHYFGTLYVTLSTPDGCVDLTVCYHVDIFELTYRSSLRPEILTHHFCVGLFTRFQCLLEWLIYTVQTLFAIMTFAISLQVMGENLT